MSSSSQQTNENGEFSHVWLGAITVHNSIEKINTSRVIRFTVTANVEFPGLGVRYAGGVAFRSFRRRPDAEPRRILLPPKSKGTEIREFMMYLVNL